VRAIGSVRLGLAFALVALAAATTSPAARAESWAVDDVPQYGGGPVLAGDRVGWLQPRHQTGAIDVYAPADLYVAHLGGRPRRVQELRGRDGPGGSEPDYLYDLIGSRTHLLLSRGRVCDDSECADQYDVFAGRVGSRLGHIEHCGNTLPDSASIGLSGELASMLRCDGTLVLRDLGGGRPDELAAESGALRPHLAGRYLEWLANSPNGGLDVVVYDREASRTAYVVPAAELKRGDPQVASQGDGTIALAYDPHPRDLHVEYRVGWASPSHPHLQRLPLPVRQVYGLALSRGRIAFVRTTAHPSGYFAPTHYEIGLTDLSGESRLIGRRAADPSNFDFDGRRIAYAASLKDGSVRIRTQRVR
jgi:hypothetical protein